jgi:hypothetical protein
MQDGKGRVTEKNRGRCEGMAFTLPSPIEQEGEIEALVAILRRRRALSAFYASGSSPHRHIRYGLSAGAEGP